MPLVEPDFFKLVHDSDWRELTRAKLVVIDGDRCARCRKHNAKLIFACARPDYQVTLICYSCRAKLIWDWRKMTGKLPLTHTEWLTILRHIHSELQDGLCALCQKNKQEVYVEHNHKTDRVRGVACRRCNLNLGRVEAWLSRNDPKKAEKFLLHFKPSVRASVLDYIENDGTFLELPDLLRQIKTPRASVRAEFESFLGLDDLRQLCHLGSGLAGLKRHYELMAAIKEGVAKYARVRVTAAKPCIIQN